MIDRLAEIEGRYAELSERMAAPEVLADPRRLAELGRELARLQPMVALTRSWREAQAAAAATRVLLADPDPEVRALAGDELATLEAQGLALSRELEDRLAPSDPGDERDVIVEIRAGAGGEEASLFAADLYRMYARYAERQGWKVDLISSSSSSSGGFKEAIVEVAGPGAYSRLKYESGVHRVQRVPSTEASGRIHTSTATVSVLPAADEVDVQLHERDLRIDVYRSSGPGGQSVNTTDSAVRVTHLPTGLVVAIQDEKSQHKNRARALAVLRARLQDLERTRVADERGEARRAQVGSGDRAEKIRTYNYPDDRVTDHRMGLTIHHLPAILEGDLDRLIEPMVAAQRAARVTTG